MSVSTPPAPPPARPAAPSAPPRARSDGRRHHRWLRHRLRYQRHDVSSGPGRAAGRADPADLQRQPNRPGGHDRLDGDRRLARGVGTVVGTPVNYNGGETALVHIVTDNGSGTFSWICADNSPISRAWLQSPP